MRDEIEKADYGAKEDNFISKPVLHFYRADI
jgi:hypothetical protein